MNTETITEVSRKIQDVAQFHDGNATVPGYLLEQLFLAVGLEQEHYYTESE